MPHQIAILKVVRTASLHTVSALFLKGFLCVIRSSAQVCSNYIVIIIAAHCFFCSLILGCVALLHGGGSAPPSPSWGQTIAQSQHPTE